MILGLIWRVQIVMCVAMLILAAVLVNLKVHFGVFISAQIISISVGFAFILALIIAIFWHHSALSRD